MPAQNLVYYGSSNKPVSNSGNQSLQSGDDSVLSIHDEASYKKVTEEMYKQNFELAIRNKTLSVLRTLYAITMTSFDVGEIAQRIVDTVAKELNFNAVLINVVDYQEKVLRPLAITQSPDILQAIELMGKSFSELIVALDDTSNLIIDAIKDKERKITGNILDILVPYAVQEVADEIDKIIKVKTLIVYPLILGEKAIGALTIGLGKRVDDLSRAEKETLEELIDVVTIALDRAQLHQKLSQINTELQSANEKLQELDKLKDEFVSLASHELRTPMTAIKGSISTILEGYAGEVSKESRDFLTAAYNENDRLIRLVNNLLNISRIEAGRFTFTVVKVGMDKLISEVINNLQMAAKEKNLYLKYETDGELVPVFADIDKVKEVLINLIGNALKFTHEGGITIKASRKDNMIVVSVADTGHGISKEDQDLLFKKFSQVGSYTKQVGGTGLGLYISKQIIEGLKGKIWLESTVGQGSTFFFSLPVVSA